MFRSIKKRNGKVTPFKIEKIVNAVYKASIAVGESNWQLANSLAKEVANRLQKKSKRGAVATVEEVQDMVEAVLIDSGRARIAKSAA